MYIHVCIMYYVYMHTSLLCIIRGSENNSVFIFYSSRVMALLDPVKVVVENIAEVQVNQ